MPAQLCEMSIVEIGSLLRSRKVSPVELTAEALERIAQLNPRLNAFLTITGELAKEQARAAEAEILAGHYRGPLHGVPVAVKDLFYTRGVRTTAGSKILANFVPDFDSRVVEKLRDAGAVLLGKTSLHELAYGVTNDNPHFGPTRNPWNPERTPGGSSGGSGVAVATGMAFAALGSDTGGSIRIPASFCGVAGLKPSFGRVSLHGVMPLGYTLDHVGPLARAVEDITLVYQAIAGFDPQDDFSVNRPPGEIRFHASLIPASLKKAALLSLDLPSRPRPRSHLVPRPAGSDREEPALSQPEGAVTIGVPEDYFFDRLEPEVETAVRQALRVLEDLGGRVISVKLPGMAELTEASRVSLLAEAYVVHKKNLEDHPDDLGRDVKLLIEKGRAVTASDYVNAQLARYRFRRQLEHLFHEVDVLVTPTTPLTTFPLGVTKVTLGGQEEDARTAATRLTRPFNATGHPALSVCCGFDSQGLPVGLQIVGKLWDEATLLQVGYAYEKATEWHKRRPPSA